jgi:hypothetical protein
MQITKYLAIVFLTTITLAQTPYEVHPGLKNNLFELNISVGTDSQPQSARIFVQEKPDWISFKKEEADIENMHIGENQTSQFHFDISEGAPIGEEGRIIFTITRNNGRNISKIYNIKVTAPKFFEVQQNYPNPFNPNTIIKYSIPQDAFVSIKVFNVLGERIAELVNKDLTTGVHEVVFSATNLSSGFYFYIVEAKGRDGTKYFDSKKMILLR